MLDVSVSILPIPPMYGSRRAAQAAHRPPSPALGLRPAAGGPAARRRCSRQGTDADPYAMSVCRPATKSVIPSRA